MEGYAVDRRQTLMDFVEQREQDMKGCHCKHIPIEDSECHSDICVKSVQRVKHKGCG